MRIVDAAAVVFACAAVAPTIAAQNSAASVPAAESTALLDRATPGCGPGNEAFQVAMQKGHEPNPVPVTGKALVYFVQDDRFFSSHPRPIVKWGVDGAWAGATRSKGYFHITLEPGEHHLCAQWQTAVVVSQGKEVALAHFTAEAGRVYYFRAQNVYWRPNTKAAVTLDPVDSDEGSLLASQSGMSVATLKK